ncbi:MAG TPA: GIY-YIG nuclease family protein [Polyangiaceae bacterium]|nr:GIY-YIG nuclease family protein [Polyangiaceae bacterium]
MRALVDADVLIVDCQATGASPAFGHVLELGWGILRAGQPGLAGARAHWIALPEGHRVPGPIRKITGYEPRFAADAISDSEAWRLLRADTGDAITVPTVIHYARFELAFLREWALRLEPTAPFPFDTVCVHAVAQRLYPNLPRQSIRALAGFLGYSLDLTRRSLGHVEATGFVWEKLRGELVARGIVSWEALLAFVAERAPRARPPAGTKKPKYPIAPERYRTLPDAPGVYRLLRSNGDVVYVGKATSLKRRVTSHFIGKNGTPLAPEMLTQVSDIAVTVVASALEAALLENESIKALRPPYNVQLTTTDVPVWYCARTFASAVTAPDEQHPIGPLPSELSLRPIAALIALAAGGAPAESLRSEAVGVSALFTPDEVVFLAGWAELLGRHPELAAGGVSPRRRVLDLAKKLLVLGVAPEAEASTPGDASGTRAWDAERVARHVERALVQAYRAWRRAHFFTLLHDSDVVYREPGGAHLRLLRLRDGALRTSSDAPPSHAPETRLSTDVDARPAFDRSKYDRLRVLTTELKRIVRDGGTVAVHWGPRRQLPARWLPGALAAT